MVFLLTAIPRGEDGDVETQNNDYGPTVYCLRIIFRHPAIYQKRSGVKKNIISATEGDEAANRRLFRNDSAFLVLKLTLTISEFLSVIGFK